MSSKNCFIAWALTSVATVSGAAGLTPIDDEDLAQVRGQDGVSFNLKNFSFKSDTQWTGTGLTLTYTIPNAADLLGQDPSKPVKYIQYSGIDIQRTDPVNPDDIFNDPYQIQIESVTVPDAIIPSVLPANDPLVLTKQQEVIYLRNPKNLLGELKWNMTYDWTVATDVVMGVAGSKSYLGAHMVEDLVVYGGGIALAPAWSYKNAGDVRGTAFGMDINLEIGALILRPNGRADATNQLALSGIKVGLANSTLTGVDPDKTKTWAIADVIMQPGIITAVTENGESTLHMGIDWYRGSDETQIPTGAVSVDSIKITNSANPSGYDFGSASIGGIQIRYLDVKFRN